MEEFSVEFRFTQNWQITHVPWLNFRNFPNSTINCISQVFLLSYCTTTFLHYPSSDSIKFTHPPTKTDTVGSISTATTFWCFGSVLLMLWLWKDTMAVRFKGKNPPTDPPTLVDIQHQSMMFSAFQELFCNEKHWHLFFLSVSLPYLVPPQLVISYISHNCYAPS